jgi:hypothetical protein
VLHDGSPEKTTVVSGLSDGSFTEIVRGDLKPDDQVVVDEVARPEQSRGVAQAARPHFHP